MRKLLALLLFVPLIALAQVHGRGVGAANSVLPQAYPLLAPDGSQGAPSYAFATEPGLGFHRNSAGTLMFDQGASARFFWNSTSFGGVSAGFILGAANTGFGKLYLDFTNTGTVGNVTISKPSGRVNLAAAGTTLTLTNTLITANSHVFLQVSSAPGNAVAVSCVPVPAAGSAVITCTPAVTNQVSIDFLVVNAD